MLLPLKRRRRVKRSLPRRLALGAGKVFAWANLALLVVLMLVVIGINLPLGRQLVRDQVNAQLAPLFLGKISIQEIGGIGVTGIRNARVVIQDDTGRQVLLIEDLDVGVSLLSTLHSVLLGEGPIQIDFTDVSVNHADVLLDSDPSGTPHLARAFQIRPDEKDEKQEQAEGKSEGRAIQLRFAAVRFEHAWVHGQLQDLPYLDADLERMLSAVEVTEQSVRINVPQWALRSRGPMPGADLDGSGAFKLDIPFGEQEVMALDVSYQGNAGAIPIAAVASLKGEQLDARASVSQASPEAVRNVLPHVPLAAPLSIYAAARGRLPHLDVEADVQLGAGKALVLGALELQEPTLIRANVELKQLDLQALGSDLPSSAINAKVAGRVELGHVARGTATIAIRESRLSNVEIRELAVTGRFLGESVTVRGQLNDPKASASFTIDTLSVNDKPLMAIELHAESDDLKSFAQVLPNPSGSLELDARGLFQPDASTIDSTICAKAPALHVAGVEAKAVSVCGRVFGTLAAPQIDAAARAQDIAYQGQHIPQVLIAAKGTLSDALVRVELTGAERLPSAYVATQLQLTEGPALIKPQILLWRNDVTAKVSANEVRILPKGLSINEALIESGGQPLRMNLRAEGNRLTVTAKGEGVDIHRIAYVLGRNKATQGILNVDLDLQSTAASARGRVNLSLERANIEELGKTSLQVALTLDKRRIEGNVEGSLGPGRVKMRAEEVVLAGPFNAQHSWKGARGKIELDVDVDLKRLRKLLPEQNVPFDLMVGEVQAKGTIERTSAKSSPQLALRAKTNNLELSRKGAPQRSFDGKKVHAPPVWHIADVDIEVDLRIAGSNGQTTFAGRIFDERGTMATLSFDAAIPYREWVNSPKTALSRLNEIPLEATLSVPPRNLSTLPPLLRVKGMQGTLELTLKAKQERGVPHLNLDGRVRNLKFQERHDAVPINAELSASYDDDRGKLDFKMACSERPALQVESQIEGKLSHLIRNGGRNFHWKVESRASAIRLPLRAIPPLAERRIDGLLSGNLTLSAARGELPKVDTALHVDRLSIAGVKYDRSRIQARVRNDAVSAWTRLNQVNGGFVTADLRMIPTQGRSADQVKIDEATVTLRAEHFRASALQPFLEGTVAELDGEIDANAKLELGKQTTMEGYVHYQKGRFQLETFGEEFHGVAAQLRFSRDGVILLENGVARGVSGKVTMSGRAKMDGPRLVAAHARVNIPKGRPLPVVIEGEAMAEVSGAIEIDVKQQKGTLVTVTVHKAAVRLPDKSSHDLQDLEPPQQIRVGIQRGPKQFVILPAAGEQTESSSAEAEKEPVRVAINLNNVEVRRGTTLRTRLDGRLTLEQSGTTKARGQIRLSKGRLDVEGKKFEIERGIITFVGDPSNPEVIVTAGWTAPEGTRVYADFVGPLKTGKVTLRAEPAHTQSEILSLILFGTTDGQAVQVNSSQQSGGSSDTASSAVGLGGGLATRGLNRALDDMTGLDITTRIDTSDSANPRPEVEVQIAQDISLSIAHVLGTSSAGSSLDRNFLTLDWRFMSNWSLETTFGDRGSVATDAIWQLRY